jgi:hypothetical protein
MNRGCRSDVPADRPWTEGEIKAGDLTSAVAGAVALKERLGLEYDKIMILAVIACRYVAQSARGSKKTTGAGRLEDDLFSWNGSTMSLARTLMIPRETVRRKLVELCADGWLIPNGKNGRYQPSEHLLRTIGELIPPSPSSA